MNSQGNFFRGGMGLDILDLEFDNLFSFIANAAQKDSKSSRLLLDDISNEDFLAEIDDIIT